MNIRERRAKERKRRESKCTLRKNHKALRKTEKKDISRRGENEILEVRMSEECDLNCLEELPIMT